MSITYEFEELPLIENGGFVCGEADVEIDDDGEWFVRRIYLDGVLVDPKAEKWLYTKVWTELSDPGPFKNRIDDLVAEYIGGAA